MNRTFLVFLLLGAVSLPTSVQAQQADLDELKDQLALQQEAIDRLNAQIAELEQKQADLVTQEDLEDESAAQQDEVNALRENVFSRVNINGYVNSRFFADQSEQPTSFQQHHLGLLFSKQLGRFRVFTEVELANVPHHPELVSPEGESGHAEGGEEGGASEGGEEPHAEAGGDISREGSVAVENAWIEYNHARYLNVRVGKQLSPQYWWQNHYPNLILSTEIPIFLRELFPPELTGVLVHGIVARPAGESELGLGYKLYVANNQGEASQTDLQDQKAWGGRLELHLPASGRLRVFNVAGDIYRGAAALVEGSTEIFDNDVWGFESQLQVDRFLLNAEYARGHWLGLSRFGYYVQPAVRLQDQWVAFYRLEGLESQRVQRAERRHLAGVNFRPVPEIALKFEFYRSFALERDFIRSHEGRESFNGVATAAAFFF